MILLNASNLQKIFNGSVLFDNVSFSVDSGDKIGLVGANGAGKSTLFKILAGEIDCDAGELFASRDAKIGYLEQYAVSESRNTVFEEVMEAFSEVTAIEKNLEDIRFDIEYKRGDLRSLISKQNELQEKFERLGGFYYKNRVKSTLMGLGFSEDDLNLGVDKLSGGQKTRAALGRILLGDAKLLLLDEPTNHLDIESVEWLEEFLKNYGGAFIVISHDRYFLDKVTDKTFELGSGRLRTYNGSYSKYAAQREIERKSEERSYENTMREIHRLEGVIEQQRRWNREKNIKTAESKQKVIDRLEKSLQKPDASKEEMTFSFKACEGGGMDVIETKSLSMAFGENRLFSDVNIHIGKGEKVFILGPNGCGKTTLLKILLGMCRQTAGEYKIGANIHIGYYDQIQENLSPDKTIIDEVWDEYPNLTQTQIRNALAVFLFRGEDVFKEIKSLSGGERARTELVKLMLKKVNLLIMDEPTNHLDIESREALEKALEGYDGTMLVVSHDRYFINKIADRILVLGETGVREYAGGYDDYALRRAQPQQEQKSSDGAADYREQKHLRAKRRKTANDFAKTEKAIAELEASIEEKNTELANPDIAADYVKAAEISEKIQEMTERLDSLYAEWERLQELIEADGEQSET